MDKKEIIKKALSRFPLFYNLEESSLIKLADMTDITRCEKGAVIFENVENNPKVYIIASGEIEITKAAEEESGETYGEMSMFDSFSQHSAATATEDCVLLYIARNNFLDFLKENPEITNSLLESMSIKIKYEDTKDGEEEIEPGEHSEDTPETNHEVESQQQETEDDWLFDRTYVCPYCNEKTISKMPRSKYVQVKKTDYDMCSYYRRVNPTFYYVVVCEHCGFAFPQDDRSKPPQRAMPELESNMPGLKTGEDFSGIRTIDQAIKTYSLGIRCQELKKAPHSLLGRLYLRQGCLYRHKKIEEEELACLEKALEHFQQAYMNEHISDPKGEIKLAYLVGELNGRLGNIAEAVQWFNAVTQHPDGKYNRYIVNLARERWQEFRRSQ